MLVSWSAFLILTFAASLNSLSALRLELEIDSEFREAANGTPAEISELSHFITYASD